MKYKKNYFSKNECKKIINLHKTYKNYGFNYDWYKNIYNKDNRREAKTNTFYAYLIPNSPYTKWIFDKLQMFFEETMFIEFTKNIKSCQLYKYKTGDVFQKHVDLSAEHPKRRYNLGVNLNENYEGGEYYCWDGMAADETKQIVPKETGTICTYHSRQLHEIKEITKGERWSLVIKIESDIINEKKTMI
jgi:Rps23 Pro-64 3,4-dihydroxylase Tpa1-like proline 4-hydroxylase